MTTKFKNFSDLKKLKESENQSEPADFLAKSSALEICELFDKFLFAKDDWDEKSKNNYLLTSQSLFKHIIEKLVWLRDNRGLELTVSSIEGVFEKEKYTAIILDKSIPARIGASWKWGYSAYAMRCLQPYADEWKILVERHTLEAMVPSTNNTQKAQSTNNNSRLKKI